MFENQVTLRQFEKGDTAAVLKMIDELWRLDLITQNKLTSSRLARRNLYSILMQANYTLVVDIDGKALGVLFARIDKPEKPAASQKYAKLFKHHDAILKNSPPKDFSAYQQFAKIEDAFSTLFEMTKKTFDAELLMFMTDKTLRGTGYGTVLSDSFMEELKSRGASNFYLFTDAHCTYSYYDKNGYLLENEIDTMLDFIDGKRAHKCLIYSFSLND